MACVDLARKPWKENTEELKASKAGEASAPSSAGAASDPSGGTSTAPSAPSALAQAEPEPAVEPTRPAAEPVGTTGLEAGATRPAEPAGTARLEVGATFKAPTKAGPAVKPESKPMPRPYAKPTPKVKAQTAKPVETKEPDSVREPAAGVKAPETPPQANQPGSSSTRPGDDVTYQQTEAAYDFAALLDCLDSDDKLQKVVYLFLTRVYSVFRPEKLPQVGELLAKYDLKLKTLVGAVAAKYLTKDSAENLLKDLVRGVTKGADTELGWSTELEEANRSLDEAIGYLDLDYPDAADKVRQNRRSRSKGVEEREKERASPIGTAPGLRQGSLRQALEAPRVPRAKERVQERARTQFRTPAILTTQRPVATSWTSTKMPCIRSG